MMATPRHPNVIFAKGKLFMPGNGGNSLSTKYHLAQKKSKRDFPMEFDAQ